MSDEDSQTDELLALENIYTPEEFKSLKENGQLGGHFLAFIVFENELKLLFRDLREPESSFEEISLDHLPPLSLLFSFPKDYPSSSPPDFTLSCQWLRQKDIAKLCRKLDTIWDENKGMEIMYIWTQFLKEEALKFLGMDKELDISKMYTYYRKCMETWSKRSKVLHKRWELARSDNTSLPGPVEQRAMEKAVEKGAMENSTKESRAEKAKDVSVVEKAMEKGEAENGMEEGTVEKGMEKDDPEKSIEKDGAVKAMKESSIEKLAQVGGVEKAMEEAEGEIMEGDRGEKAMEEDGVVKAKEEGWVEKAVQESGAIKIMDGEMEKTLPKVDQNCTEQQRLMEYNVLVVDRDDSKENHVCGTMAGAVAVKTYEESKCSLQGVMQNCCRNTKPLEHNSAGPSWRRFSPENVQSTKETGYNRRYRSSRELKGGKNKQNLLSQKRLEPSKDNDTNKVDTATCNTTCDMSRTEMKDTLNESKKNGNLGSKFCRRQGTNHVGETKLNNHHHCSSKADHTVVNELRKSDTRSELVCVNGNTNSARGKGVVRQRRNARKPKNSSHTEQEKETRQLQMRHRHRHVDKRAIVDLHPRTSVIQHLVDYNIKQRELLFERNMHTCTICFEDKLGVYCMKFEPCRHVFCSDCITNYFEVRIMEGTVLSIPCPEDKCPSEAQPSDVRALVSPEMYTKYDSILLSAVLDTQSSVYCPRRQCRYPVLHEDKTDKLATCPECNYAFCVLCEKVYHGVAPCVIVPEEKRKLMEEYARANNVKKRKMEAKYGKQQLKNLVDTFHLEWSESWIKKNSKKCPHCNTAIEKAAGCNKMQCSKCDTFFCWLCNTRLDKLKPYEHFNSPNSPCYNNLLHGIVMVEDFDDEFEFEEEFDEEEEEEEEEDEIPQVF